MPILKEGLDALSKYGVLKTALPEVVTANLNPAFPLRDYQKEALFRFIYYITDWGTFTSQEDADQDLESCRKKAVGEPYEGKPHVRFEVAGGGNRDTAVMIEALPKETGSKQAVRPKS